MEYKSYDMEDDVVFLSSPTTLNMNSLEFIIYNMFTFILNTFSKPLY